jgi:hypothetical protein
MKVSTPEAVVVPPTPGALIVRGELISPGELIVIRDVIRDSDEQVVTFKSYSEEDGLMTVESEDGIIAQVARRRQEIRKWR